MSVRLMRCIISIFCLSLLCSVLTAGKFDRNPEVAKFIQEAKAENFSEAKLRRLFHTMRYRQDILDLMDSHGSGTGITWPQYRKLFVNPKMIAKGVEYWNKNRESLAIAQEIYGVPPEIIVSFIGVESRYGVMCGRSKTMEALCTLAFYDQARQEMFRTELKEYLLLTRELHQDPLQVRGSYAGAMGKPQFMPSSYRKYGVDLDLDNKVDLFNSDADIIASIGNYLYANGWEENKKIILPLKPRGKFYPKLAKQFSLEPNLRFYQLYLYGFFPPEYMALNTKCRLIVLKDKNTKTYLAGFNNFYVITLYNHSTMYAMAVNDLAQELRKEYDKIAVKQK